MIEQINKEERILEACKGICDFMGIKDYSGCLIYSQSLDKLLPVWQKIDRIKKLSFNLDGGQSVPFRIRRKGNRLQGSGKVFCDSSAVTNDLFKSACLATWHTIQRNHNNHTGEM